MDIDNENSTENTTDVDENNNGILQDVRDLVNLKTNPRVMIGPQLPGDPDAELEETEHGSLRGASPMSEESDTPPPRMHTTRTNTREEDGEEEGEEEEDDVLKVEEVTLNTGEDEVLDMQRFEWTLEGFSQVGEGEKVTSPSFKVHNIPFRFMLYPKGHQNNGKSTSCFLELDRTDIQLPVGFEAFAVFKLGVLLTDGRRFERAAKHRFVETSTNWGFAGLLEMKYLKSERYMAIKDDKVTYTAEVCICNGDDYDLWGIYSHYDSKKCTGMVGLENQGATCYMNSLLQTLYFTNMLRHAVFQMPTSQDDNVRGVALALQRVFYRLMAKDKAVETTELTRSFGWDSVQAFMQHDVQELTRVLMDNMEEKMKGTPVEGSIAKLFEGKMKSYIKCINVDYESSREESFYDISLNVKGMGTLINSFREYVKVERMDGENQYRAEGHGLQDANKGIIFKSFPPVLHLQLKRFEYSWERDESEKINDRFEFGEHINLDEFLEHPDPHSPADYTLHSVLVHSGSLHGGHYVVFVRPALSSANAKHAVSKEDEVENDRKSKQNSGWFKFDDSMVTRTAAENAIERNYGEDASAERRFRSYSNAYMLVYIRDSMIDEVMRPLALSDIPHELVHRFEEEEAEKQRKIEESRLASMMMDVTYITDEQIATNSGTELVPLSRMSSVGKTIKARKDTTIENLLELLSKEVGVPAARLRIWPFITRENKTYRPENLLVKSDMKRHILSLAKSTASGARFSFFLDIVPEDEQSSPFPTECDEEEDFVVFVKWFEPETGTLSYLGHAIVNSSWSISQLVPCVLQARNLPDSTKLLAFEEVKASMISKLDLDSTFHSHELQVGDILTFQVAPPDEDEEDEENGERPLVKHRTAKDYYVFLQNQVMVEFKEYNKDDVPGFKLKLDRRMDYSMVARHVAEHLGSPIADHFQFSQNRYFNHTDNILMSSLSLDGMLRTVHAPPNIIYYEILPVPLREAETKVKMGEVGLFDHETFSVEPVEVFLDRDATTEDLIELLRPKAKPFAKGSGKFRALLITTWDTRVLDLSENVTNYFRYPVRVEEIPSDQLDLPENVRLHHFYHVWKEFRHGIPFIFPVHDGETIADLKARLKEYMKVSDKEWNTWKFGASFERRTIRPSDDDVIRLEQVNPNTDFFFEHVDRTVKRSGFFLEQAVKIHN